MDARADVASASASAARFANGLGESALPFPLVPAMRSPVPRVPTAGLSGLGEHRQRQPPQPPQQQQQQDQQELQQEKPQQRRLRHHRLMRAQITLAVPPSALDAPATTGQGYRSITGWVGIAWGMEK